MIRESITTDRISWNLQRNAFFPYDLWAEIHVQTHTHTQTQRGDLLIIIDKCWAKSKNKKQNKRDSERKEMQDQSVNKQTLREAYGDTDKW